ncbi:condensin-2 complex subunit G2-like [Amblyomma americanum]
MESAATTYESLMVAASRRGALAKAELLQMITELPSEELGSLWTAVLEKLQTIVPLLLRDDKSDQECLPLVALCHAAAHAGIVCAPMVNVARLLSGLACLLKEGVLLNSIQALCLTWIVKKNRGWKRLWTSTFSRAIELSLKEHSKTKTEDLIKSVFLMKDGLVLDESEYDTVEMDSSERMLLRDQLVPCAVSANYLDSAKGRKVVSFLLTLDKSLVSAIQKKVNGVLPLMTSAHVQALAQVYVCAWKAVAGKEQATVLEENIQKIMDWTVNGDISSAHQTNLFRFLRGLHAARKDRALARMLYQCYLPILWRGLKALHYKVRLRSARIFFDSFPLLESTAAPEMEQELAENFRIMHALLVDSVPDIRAVAVRGVCKVLTDFFEIIPVHERKALGDDLINKNAVDLNSLDSRVRVNQGLAYMTRSPKAHNLLRALIVKNKDNSLQDTHSVQLSYVSLLLEARRIPGFRFWDVTPPNDLLPLLAESRPNLSLTLAKLLRNSYFDPMADERNNIERCFLLHSLNPEAFRVFYRLLTDVAPIKPIMNFLVAICKAVRLNCSLLRKIAAEENSDPGKSSGTECDQKNIIEQSSVHILVETLAITYNSLSLCKELCSDELKEQWKYLVAIMKKSMNELFPLTDCLSMKISVLSVASLLPSREVGNLAMRCLVMLRGFLTVPEADTPMLLSIEAKACVMFLCNMRRTADVLGMVTDSVGKLKSQQTPIKSHRVRFCVADQQSCNTELTLQVLRFMLESPQLQIMVLKSHTVPLFNTWSTLLSIVDSVQEFLCASNSRMLIEVTMLTAYDLFLLLTYVLHGQEHPVTKEKFVAIAAFERQMIWVEEDLLPRLQGRSGISREPHLEILKMYLKVARSVLMTTWVSFEFAENFLKFLLLCQEIEEDQLKTPIALIPPVVKEFMPIFAKTKKQSAIISALVEKVCCEVTADKCFSPESQSGRSTAMDTAVVSASAFPSTDKNSGHASLKTSSASRMDMAVASDRGSPTSVPLPCTAYAYGL